MWHTLSYTTYSHTIHLYAVFFFIILTILYSQRKLFMFHMKMIRKKRSTQIIGYLQVSFIFLLSKCPILGIAIVQHLKKIQWKYKLLLFLRIMQVGFSLIKFNKGLFSRFNPPISIEVSSYYGLGNIITRERILSPLKYRYQ